MDIRLSTIFAYFEYLLSLLVPRFVANDGCLDIVELVNMDYQQFISND